ncbi:hypothetical protein [Desulfosporosinus sp. I2]|uniref:hypothetical protein n=1 Tax=Desulfosporosinus sp. I2 TaxID=1617025 RepID=UPI0012E08D34|nr:hypothetical protein [Desulfosporosinus sp. I2]
MDQKEPCELVKPSPTNQRGFYFSGFRLPSLPINKIPIMQTTSPEIAGLMMEDEIASRGGNPGLFFALG